MNLYRLCLFILGKTAGYGLFAQVATNPDMHVNATGQVYVKADSPIYFFVSPIHKPDSKALIPSNDSLANPVHFNGPGKRYFVYDTGKERIRYLITADAKGPTPRVRVDKGLLFGKNSRFYVDINSRVSLAARDDYSGLKDLYYSLDGAPFSLFEQSIAFDKEGERELRVYAIDNVGNIGDTSVFKIVVSPEATFKADNIYFETGSARLLDESANNLAEILHLMQSFPELTLEITAHADVRGSSESNQRLSERRAQSVASYLTTKGIEPRRLKARGLGDTSILNDCTKGTPCPDEKHRQNRRVEFKFSLPK